MKQLATDFTEKGFRFHLIMREADIVLFKKQPIQGEYESFEVAKVRKYPDYEIAGVHIAAHEALPPNNSWGIEAFTFTDEDSAFARFQDLYHNSPYSAVAGVATGKAKGRKRDAFEIEIPKGEFTVKQLVAKYPEKSVPFLHLRLNELREKGKVRVVRTERTESRKGKPRNVYEEVPITELPTVLETAEKSVTVPSH